MEEVKNQTPEEVTPTTVNQTLNFGNVTAEISNQAHTMKDVQQTVNKNVTTYGYNEFKAEVEEIFEGEENQGALLQKIGQIQGLKDLNTETVLESDRTVLETIVGEAKELLGELASEYGPKLLEAAENHLPAPLGLVAIAVKNIFNIG